jgi:integration host factor subunit beta
MATVTKKELIDRIAENESCKRIDVKRIIQTFLDSIVEELAKGNRLEFRDFGVFECRMRAPRDAQNPKTMAKVKVPPKRTVKFKAGRVMKLRLHETPAEIDQATGLTVESSAHLSKAAVAAGGDGALRRRSM